MSAETSRNSRLNQCQSLFLTLAYENYREDPTSLDVTTARATLTNLLRKPTLKETLIAVSSLVSEFSPGLQRAYCQNIRLQGAYSHTRMETVLYFQEDKQHQYCFGSNESYNRFNLGMIRTLRVLNAKSEKQQQNWGNNLLWALQADRIVPMTDLKQIELAMSSGIISYDDVQTLKF